MNRRVREFPGQDQRVVQRRAATQSLRVLDEELDVQRRVVSFEGEANVEEQPEDWKGVLTGVKEQVEQHRFGSRHPQDAAGDG